MSDIDALRAELEALRHEFDELRLHLPDAYVEGDLATDRVTFMNRVACQVFGCTPEQATGLHARDLFDDGEFERARGQMAAMLERGYAEGGGARYVRSGHQDLREFRMRRRDGTSFPAETQSSIVVDLAGQARGVRTLVRDISARKELEAKLEEMSLRDPLTGCFNRRYLEKRQAELEQTSAHWVCLLFDLTDFKGINDTYGHDEGDRVLRAFAHFLSRQHRSDDILVRLGGDEFALFVRALERGRGPRGRGAASWRSPDATAPRPSAWDGRSGGAESRSRACCRAPTRALRFQGPQPPTCDARRAGAARSD